MATRADHNAKWNVTRLPADVVYCHTMGYGEISQYDPDCAACWLGHLHTWDDHDRMLGQPDGRRERTELAS